MPEEIEGQGAVEELQEGAQQGAEGEGNTQADDQLPAPKMVPLEALHEARAKQKDLERRLREVERRAGESADTEALDSLKRRYMSAEGGNYDEKAAIWLAQNDLRIQRLERRMEQRRLDAEMASDIRDLARSDEFFEDAEKFAPEITAKMREKGVSAEEAYMLLRGRARTQEMQTKGEQQRAAARRSPAQAKVETGAAAPRATSVKIKPEDKRAYDEMIARNPDRVWTPAAFYEFMDGNGRLPPKKQKE